MPEHPPDPSGFDTDLLWGVLEGRLEARRAWKPIAAQEIVSRIVPAPFEDSLSASEEAFTGLSRLLSANPAPDAYDALAHAVMRLAQAEAAWLLAPAGTLWTVLGRAWREPSLHTLRADSGLRRVPLMSDGELVGGIALWYPHQVPGPESPLETAFEHALASALRTRRDLDESQRLMLRDPLTGLMNRRALDVALPRLVAIAQRSHRPLSLLMFDIDFFKRVNDTYGHEAGDEVLRAFGKVLLAERRASDMTVRYGGEEFLMALPDTATGEALGVAEKLRRATERLEVPLKDGRTIHLTTSVGVAGLHPADDGSALIARADLALYQAKASGRNRSLLYDPRSALPSGE